MKDIRDILDNRNALEKYIKSQVGRPWNKVFQEICAVADPRTSRGYKVRDSLDWMVEKNCVLEDGKPYDLKYRRHPVNGLYVHPSTGILSYYSRKKFDWAQPRTREREINYISLKDGTWFQTDDNGNWFHHWIVEKKERYRSTAWDPDLKKYVPIGDTFRENITKIFNKRQLNTKEVKHLKKHLLMYGTNKNMLSRLYGKYVPASQWKLMPYASTVESE